jgi:hypothetical protein
MKRNITLSLITGALVWLPWLSWAAIKTYILAEPDSKFGAMGGVLFVAAFWGFAAFIAAIAFLSVRFLISLREPCPGRSNETVSALLSGLLLAIAAKFLPLLPPVGERLLGEIPGIILCWGLICLTVCAAVQTLVVARTPKAL